MELQKFVFAKLKKLQTKKFNLKTKVSDLEIDSLDLVEIVIACEQEFGLHVPDDKFVNMKKMTIGEVIDLIANTKK